MRTTMPGSTTTSGYLLTRLETLGATAFDADPYWQRNPPTPGTLGVCDGMRCCGLHVMCLSSNPFSRRWQRQAGMVMARVSRRDSVRFHGPQPRRPGRFFLPDGGSCLAGAYPAPGANAVTWGFPVTVCLVAGVWGNFGRAFWARSECRSRPAAFRVCRAARAALSAAAARAASDDVPVTWDQVMERIA